MLLRQIRSARLRKAARDDEGMALAAVMGLVVIMLIISIAVASATISATSFATATRADVQSQAAAESGVDAAYAAIKTGASNGSLPCTVSASSTTPIYSVVILYNGASAPCSGTFGGTPTSAVVRSTGTAANAGLRATDGDTATVAANLTFTTTAASTTSTLTNMMYAGSSLTLANDVTLAQSASGAQDASIYTPGALSCNTSSSIQGNVIAQGSISIPNTCSVTGYVWSAGPVSLTSSSANIAGDVYSAGAVSVGAGHVGGAVVAQGAVTVDNGGQKACSGLSSTWSVCGSVFSLGSTVTFANGSNTGGSAYANGNIDLGSANSATIVNKDVLSSAGNVSASNASGTTVGNTVKVTGTVSGLTTSRVGASSSSCQFGATTPFTKCSGAQTIPSTPNPTDTFPSTLGYPAASGSTASVNGPATQTMPAITNDSAGLAKWTAAGWTVTTVNSCDAGTAAVRALTASSPKTLINITTCSSQIGVSNSQLTVYNDLAIMSPGGFLINNGGSVASSSSTYHQFELIVPSGSNGPITTDGTTFTNLYTLFYTASGEVRMNNGITGFIGQIYSGNGIYGPGTAATLTMHSMAVPGATTSSGSGTATTTVALSSRYDAAG